MVSLSYKDFVLNGNIFLERIVENSYLRITSDNYVLHIYIDNLTSLFELSKGLKSYIGICNNFINHNNLGVYNNITTICLDLECYLNNFIDLYKCTISIDSIKVV